MKRPGAQPSADVLDALPLVPLLNNVLFPGTVMPVTVGAPAVMQLLEAHLPKSKQIGLFLQRDDVDREPRREDLRDVGVIATVLKMMRPPDGPTILLVQAEQRIRILDVAVDRPGLVARVALLQDTPPDMSGDYWQAKVRNLNESAARLIGIIEDAPEQARMMLSGIDEPGFLTDFLGSNLGIGIPEKQTLLEETNVGRRVDLIQQSVDNLLRIAELQHKLRAEVDTGISESQKRAYLREQLRAIQKELGEEGSTAEQAEELRARLNKAGLPESAWPQVERELQRLDMLPPASPDHSVVVTYLETLAELPWSAVSEDKLELDRARQVLDRDHFGLRKVKQRLIEFLAVRKLNPEGHGPILCLLGPPGVGKTSVGQSVANALGRKFVRLSLGGLRDEAEIRGHRRTYVGSMPGRIIQELRRAGTRNPVVMLDEIDKIGSDFRGDPASALLEVLDPAQNHAFSDRYLDIPFDLSQTIFIATCNVLTTIPPPLRDRMEIIEMPGYTRNEKLQIAKDYLIPRQVKECGLSPQQCQWNDAALSLVIENYTREAGVRDLERRIAAVCRNAAMRVAEGDTGSRVIEAADVSRILGAPAYVHDEHLRHSEPGVVTGLAYTPFGGDVLYVEAIKYAGTGKTLLTGQLGDVMQESVRAAFSLVRNRAVQLGIDADQFTDTDVHVHVPAGAIQKDGPSAGVAMFTALASLFMNRPVSKSVAMTGEISLRGLVLPIGGLKEKTMAALHAGIDTVIFPRLNEKDLPELPSEVTEHLTFVPVDTVDDVLAHALTDGPAEADAQAAAI